MNEPEFAVTSTKGDTSPPDQSASEQESQKQWEESLESGPRRINKIRDMLVGAINSNAFTKQQFRLLEDAVDLMDSVTGRKA